MYGTNGAVAGVGEVRRTLLNCAEKCMCHVCSWAAVALKYVLQRGAPSAMGPQTGGTLVQLCLGPELVTHMKSAGNPLHRSRGPWDCCTGTEVLAAVKRAGGRWRVLVATDVEGARLQHRNKGSVHPMATYVARRGHGLCAAIAQVWHTEPLGFLGCI